MRTPKQHSEDSRKGGLATQAARTPKQRSEIARKGALTVNAARTPKQRSEISRKGGLAAQAARTPGQRSEFARKNGLTRHAAMTPGQRSEFARKGGLATQAVFDSDPAAWRRWKNSRISSGLRERHRNAELREAERAEDGFVPLPDEEFATLNAWVADVSKLLKQEV